MIRKGIQFDEGTIAQGNKRMPAIGWDIYFHGRFHCLGLQHSILYVFPIDGNHTAHQDNDLRSF